MSGTRGKPVHLTNGERGMLVGLIDVEVLRLRDMVELATCQDKQSERIRLLRMRQFKRIRLELTVVRDEMPEGRDES